MPLRRALLLAIVLATPLAAQDGGGATGPVPDTATIPHLPRPDLEDYTRWTFAIGHRDSVVALTDWPGLRPEGRYVLGWSRWHSGQPRTLERNGRSVRFDNALQLTRFDCALSASQDLRVIRLLNGVAVDSADLEGKWLIHRSNSYDGRVLETACTPAAPDWPVPTDLPEARWTELGWNYGTYGPEVAVDTESRTRIGEYLYGWVRYTYDTPPSNEQGKRYDRRYAIYRVDCDGQRTQILRNYYMMGTTQVEMAPLPWPWSDARNRGRGDGRINSALCYYW
jgi:hypothetical protein